MKVISTLFKEVFLLETKIHNDFRGSFIERYKNLDFTNIGTGRRDNLTYSKKDLENTLSIHFAQSKLVSKGKVLDVVVDIRRMPTFGKHFTQELSDQNT